MPDKRWQPPPLENQQTGQQPKVTVDEKVVRKMLAVNPSLRKGRTTQQVKRALERGETVGGTTRNASPTSIPTATVAAAGSMRHELGETVSFFIRGKAEALTAQLDDLVARKRALEDEEARAKGLVGEQIVAFLALLGPGAVDQYGSAALAPHHKFFASLGLTAAGLLEQARKARRS
jgi:hypothetical protein